MRRTALVTGGGRGIGQAVVEALARDAWVAALDVAFSSPSPAGGAAIYADVRDGSAVQRAVDKVLDQRGGIDWVVCAAGVTRDRVSWKMTDAEWDDVIAVNLSGAFHVTRATARALRNAPSGRVVLIGSINGVRGKFGQVNYAASKAGLVGLGRAFALEVARDGVTVNVVAPGFIDTDMTRALPEDIRKRAVDRTPLGRAGQVSDVAALVRFLCSEAAGFMTGTVIPIDGGQLLGEAV